MPLTVHMFHQPEPDTDTQMACLHAHLDPSIALTTGKTIPDAPVDVLVHGLPKHEQIEAIPDLRALVIPWAGMQSEVRTVMQAFPHVTVHNLHHNAIPTAENAIALLFAAAKWLVPVDRMFRGGDWTARYESYPALMLHGKTALILGYGAIGQHIGTVLRAMGMTVIATRRTQRDPDNGIYPASELHTLLPRANALMIALPGTPETEGLIGAEELALMPENSLLVNIGRGGIVDQHALYNALVNGPLNAAASDVWYNYPANRDAITHTMPADAPLHELDNMVMSPHRAGMGGTGELETMRMIALAELLNTLASGDFSANRVNVDAGY